MFSIGCIQSQSCHADRCPTGVTTQNPWRQRGLVVPEKAQRAYQYHRGTMMALSEVIAATGVEHPRELTPSHVCHRNSSQLVEGMDYFYDWLRPGELLEGCHNEAFRNAWATAQAASFAPTARPWHP
ncbi:hypothetical protein LG327_14320 [Marinobacter sp.]